MFKARNLRDGSDITILASHWDMHIEQLRALDRQDQLVCPGCEQPVRVRVPRRRRRHFAHKHLQNCPYASASPAILEARALLYHWLASQSGFQVEIEKQLPGLNRPVDCWLEGEHGSCAYYILPGSLHPQNRSQLKEAMGKTSAQVRWLFLDVMLRAEAGRLDRVFLTTTEREFAQQTAYDENQAGPPGQSLHYLNTRQQTLTTYRGLICVHAPQLYQGHYEQSPLTEVKISPVSGEFIHPGEQLRVERLRQVRLRRDAEVARKEKARLEAVQRFFEGEKGIRNKGIGDQGFGETGIREPNNRIVAERPQIMQTEAVCVFCGQITSDYWYLNRADGTCKCRECYRAGRY